jgi:hypothetical protein
MPSSGQLLKHEEREPISPAISAWGIIEYHKRGVTLKTSGNPHPSGRGGGQSFAKNSLLIFVLHSLDYLYSIGETLKSLLVAYTVGGEWA